MRLTKVALRFVTVLFLMLVAGSVSPVLGQQVLLDAPVQAGDLTVYPVLGEDLEPGSDYYYVPTRARLAEDARGRPQFSFLRYVENVRPGEDEETAREGEGGGIVHAVVQLDVEDATVRAAESALQRVRPGARIVGPVVYRSGTFGLVSSFVQEDGDLTRQVVGLGAAPVLEGSKAAISMRLTKLGAKILWESFEMPQPDISFVFEMQMEGLRAPIRARLEADWDRMYRHTAFGAAVATPVLAGEVAAAFDDLRDQGAIRLVQVGQDAQMDKMVQVAYDKLATLMFEPLDGTGMPSLGQLAGQGAGGGLLDRATTMLADARAEADRTAQRVADATPAANRQRNNPSSNQPQADAPTETSNTPDSSLTEAEVERRQNEAALAELQAAYLDQKVGIASRNAANALEDHVAAGDLIADTSTECILDFASTMAARFTRLADQSRARALQLRNSLASNGIRALSSSDPRLDRLARLLSLRAAREIERALLQHCQSEMRELRSADLTAEESALLEAHMEFLEDKLETSISEARVVDSEILPLRNELGLSDEAFSRITDDRADEPADPSVVTADGAPALSPEYATALQAVASEAEAETISRSKLALLRERVETGSMRARMMREWIDSYDLSALKTAWQETRRDAQLEIVRYYTQEMTRLDDLARDRRSRAREDRGRLPADLVQRADRDPNAVELGEVRADLKYLQARLGSLEVLGNQLDAFRTDHPELPAELSADIDEEVSKVTEGIEDRRAEIARQEARIAELERALSAGERGAESSEGETDGGAGSHLRTIAIADAEKAGPPPDRELMKDDPSERQRPAADGAAGVGGGAAGGGGGGGGGGDAASGSRPGIAAVATLQLRRTRQRGTFELDMNKYMAGSQPITFSQPIGDVSRYKDDETVFRQVNLDQPLFRQREVAFRLDGLNAEDFGEYVNFIHVQLRRGADVREELTVGAEEFNERGHDFRLVYGFSGEESRDEWMRYEYRTVWSLFGGLDVEQGWEQSRDGTVALPAPYIRRTVELEGDPGALEGVRAVTARLYYTAGEEERFSELTLRPDRGETVGTADVLLPVGETEYGYEILWLYGNNDTVSSGRQRTSNPLLFLDPPQE